MSNEEIKKVTLAYCVDNLTKKKQDVVANLRNTLNELIMDACKDEVLEIVKNDLDEVMNKFQSKSTKTYDFLLNGGEKNKESMFILCKRMIEKEEFPLSFRKTLLSMIWKRKGPAEVLKIVSLSI